jgi:hypothetical protein
VDDLAAKARFRILPSHSDLPVNLPEYREHVEAIPYGKRLPSALYVFRAEGASLGEKLDALLTRVAATCGADARVRDDERSV